jgi:cytochrome c oxidase assembly protein subunit 15
MTSPDISKKNQAVARWLFLGVAMIIIQIFLGGVTRLTGSGLSITEWKPIMGAIPPLNEADWSKAFAAYQKTGQYRYLNFDFTLADFKAIFFWEWIHRLWARLLGVVFAIGFLFFLLRGYFNKQMVLPFVLLFALGALQGLVGWVMVQSGLNPDDLYVSHIRLALHFIAALVLLVYTFWFSLQLRLPQGAVQNAAGLRYGALGLLLLLGVQLCWGAFMAGLKAAPAAATWPSINGSWVPSSLAVESWISHKVNVHFVHRNLAYLIAGLIGVYSFFASRMVRGQDAATLFSRVWAWPLLFVLAQVILGIATVLLAPTMGRSMFGLYELLAEAHQLVAILLLLSLVATVYALSPRAVSKVAQVDRGTTAVLQKGYA